MGHCRHWRGDCEGCGFEEGLAHAATLPGVPPEVVWQEVANLYAREAVHRFLSWLHGREVEPYAGWWGTRWFMLPNPQYGSWEGALFGNDYSLSREEKLERKMQHLRTGGR